MVFGVDEDRVVRTGGHARLTTDADRLVEIHDPIGALEHRGGRAGGDARSVGTLVTAGDLVRAARLREDAHVDVLDVSARHRKWNQIFRLAGSGAGVTTNATSLVDDLGPLHRSILWFFEHQRSGFGIWGRRTIPRRDKTKRG